MTRFLLILLSPLIFAIFAMIGFGLLTLAIGIIFNAAVKELYDAIKNKFLNRGVL